MVQAILNNDTDICHISKIINAMKIKLRHLAGKVFLSLILISGLSTPISAQNLISNGDFETWEGISTDTGLDKGIPAGWTSQTGDGNLTLYRTGTPHKGNYSVFARNTSGNVSRMFTPTLQPLSAGKMYKLTYYTRGKGTLANITLTENGEKLNGAVATSPSDKNIFASPSMLNKEYNNGEEWEKQEYTFTIQTDGIYKLIFWPKSTAGTDGETSDYFLLDDIELVEFVDETICTLSEIIVKGSTLKEFDPGILTYNITLAKGTAIPKVTATPADTKASVKITAATKIDGTEPERTTTINVTAADGISTREYKIIFEESNEILREGFASEDRPEKFTYPNKTNWIIDANAAQNNGVFFGNNSIRPKGSDFTDDYFTINNCTSAGILSFYLKNRGDNANAILTVSYQKTSDSNNWIELKTIPDSEIGTSYEKISLPINSGEPINIKFHIQKTAGLIGYNIDDISLTPFIATKQENEKTGKDIVFANGNTIHLQTSIPTNYTLYNINGQICTTGNVSGEYTLSVDTAGMYIVSLQNANGKSVHKIIIP